MTFMHLSVVFSLILFSFLISSCNEKVDLRTATIVLAIEGLSGNDFSCQHYEDLEYSGFRILCNEAVRFTHAFTPSPLAQPAIASILTGKVPFLHELKDNGMTSLSAKELTLAEKLILNGIRTFFIVSAPTIKRSSRLHQGFEMFHDEYEITPKYQYRPISQSIQIFKSWLLNEGGAKNRYFGIIHISDLLFPQISTQSEQLEPRSKGLEGQMEEIDENLYLLFMFLKQKKMWDKMNVILTGINGITSTSRMNEQPGNNLYTENVSVPLFIKMPKGREENPLQWKIDSIVTLQDLGVTLQEMQLKKMKPIDDRNPLLYGKSLMPLLESKNAFGFKDRVILIESSWSRWNGSSGIRYSLRDGQWLFIYDSKPLLYNTMTDRNEINRVSSKDTSYLLMSNQFKNALDTIEVEPFKINRSTIIEDIRLAQIIVENEGRPLNSYINELNELALDNKASEMIRFLMLDLLINYNEWDKIKNFNNIWRDDFINSILNLKIKTENKNETDACLNFLAEFKNLSRRTQFETECKAKDFELFLDFLYADTEKKEQYVERLVPLIRNQLLTLKLIYLDLSKGGTILGGNDFNLLKEVMLFKSILNNPIFQKERLLLERHGVFKRDL